MTADSEIGERLARARRAAGYPSAAAAARALSVPYPTYAGHENGARGLRGKLEDYARRFGVTTDWLLTGKGSGPKSSDHLVEPVNATIGDKLPNAVKTIPLYGHAIGGQDGEFVLNGNKLDDIAAPPSISGIAGAYAVTVAGESMEPRYFDGETVFVDPGRRVMRGDFVVAQIHHPEADGSAPLAYIKRFVRRNDKELVLEQFNPVKELRFDHRSVVSVHYIVMGGRVT